MSSPPVCGRPYQPACPSLMASSPPSSFRREERAPEQLHTSSDYSRAHHFTYCVLVVFTERLPMKEMTPWNCQLIHNSPNPYMYAHNCWHDARKYTTEYYWESETCGGGFNCVVRYEALLLRIEASQGHCINSDGMCAVMSKHGVSRMGSTHQSNHIGKRQIRHG